MIAVLIVIAWFAGALLVLVFVSAVARLATATERIAKAKEQEQAWFSAPVASNDQAEGPKS